MTYKELIGFFKERLVELLDNATLDSYRVRHHNTLSILKEKEISFTFSSNIIFLLGKLIDLNEETYLKALWDKIELFIFNDKELSKEDFIPQVDELNQMTMNLVRQLLNTGYSKSSLFKAVTNFIELPDSIEEFRKFRRKHSGGNHKIYKVVFRLRIPNKLNINSAQLTRQLPEEICNATDKKNTTHQKFIKSTINHYFFHTDIPAYDRQSALREGKRQLLEELDTLYLCRDRMEAHIDDRALTIYKKANGENVTYSHNIPLVLEGAFSHTEKIANQFRKYVIEIRQNASIDTSVKMRINEAFRHLRIGNLATEVEQAFINYWIALEFIFSSPMIDQNTYSRLKPNLINILSACYIKRNLLYTESKLRKDNIIKKDEYLTREILKSCIKFKTVFYYVIVFRNTVLIFSLIKIKL